MTIDISSLSSIYGSLLGTSSGSNILSGTSGSTSFADYFLNATSTSSTSDNTQNSLYSELSSFGTSGALQSLLGGTTDTSSAISAYLSTSSTSNYGDETTATDTFSNFLQSNFQAQQMKMMSGALERLQLQTTTYQTSMGENPNDAAKLRLEQMTKNVEALQGYMTQKQTELSTNNTLLDQLQANSSYQQYIANSKTSLI